MALTQPTLYAFTKILEHISKLNISDNIHLRSVLRNSHYQLANSLNVVVRIGMLVKLTNKSMLYARQSKYHVTFN